MIVYEIMVEDTSSFQNFWWNGTEFGPDVPDFVPDETNIGAEREKALACFRKGPKGRKLSIYAYDVDEDVEKLVYKEEI